MHLCAKVACILVEGNTCMFWLLQFPDKLTASFTAVIVNPPPDRQSSAVPHARSMSKAWRSLCLATLRRWGPGLITGVDGSASRFPGLARGVGSLAMSLLSSAAHLPFVRWPFWACSSSGPPTHRRHWCRPRPTRLPWPRPCARRGIACTGYAHKAGRVYSTLNPPATSSFLHDIVFVSTGRSHPA